MIIMTAIGMQRGAGLQRRVAQHELQVLDDQEKMKPNSGEELHEDRERPRR